MATKFTPRVVHFFAFRSSPAGIRAGIRDPQSNPLKVIGHIGVSLNGGKNIFGFQPIIPANADRMEILRELVQDRKLFPGQITEDTAVFKEMQQANLPKQEVVFIKAELTEVQYKALQEQLKPEAEKPKYGFSKSVGGFNCGSFFSKHLKIDAVNELGVMEKVVDQMITGGGKKWDGKEQKE